MESDVVIIGAGGAGMSAACTAKEAGARYSCWKKVVSQWRYGAQRPIGPRPGFQARKRASTSPLRSTLPIWPSYVHGAFAEQGRELPASIHSAADRADRGDVRMDDRHYRH
ncbi:MAG: FAD-binding protein [Adlercreutzia equolifaciens]